MAKTGITEANKEVTWTGKEPVSPFFLWLRHNLDGQQVASTPIHTEPFIPGRLYPAGHGEADDTLCGRRGDVPIWRLPLRAGVVHLEGGESLEVHKWARRRDPVNR